MGGAAGRSFSRLWRTGARPLIPAACLALLACGGQGGPSPRHVLLVTVDTLRADRVGAYGYPRETTPFLDRLASEGTLFERPVVQWPKTGPSFASIWTGQYPQTTGLTHAAAVPLPEGYLTLPEFFRELGFATAAVVSNGVLNSEIGWSQGFDEYLETWHTEGGDSDDPRLYRKTINALRVNELALPLLERRRGEERLFLWLHYSDPHAPYFLPEGHRNPFLGDPYYRGDEVVALENPRATALGHRRDLKYYVAQYDANVRLVDRAIEEVLTAAASLGLLEDALVVFTADHGESLGEHGYYFGHGRLPYNTTALVPLVFHWPGRVAAGRRVASPVELVDLYPTLRELVAPERQVAGLEGKSLAGLLAPGRGVAETRGGAFSQAGGGSPLTHYRSVQERDWKLVYHPPLDGSGERYELYHLAADPMEATDLAGEHPGEVARLREVLFGWMKGSTWIRRPQSFIEEHSRETLRALRALGYIR